MAAEVNPYLTSFSGGEPTQRRGSLPNLSKPSFGLSKLLSPISVSVAIDNPLVFLYPQPPAATADRPVTWFNPNHPSTNPSYRNSRRGSQASATANETSTAESQISLHRHPVSTNGFHSALSHGDQDGSHTVNSQGTVLSGTLVLNLLKPKELRKIIITLWGQSYIGFNDRPYEHQTILSQDTKVDLEAQLIHQRDQHPNPGAVQYNPVHETYSLQKGTYRFSWSFILEPDLPPYERGQFGRTTHKVVARLKFGSHGGGRRSSVKSVGKNLSSMLVGVGGGGQEIEAESYFVAICNPMGPIEESNGRLDLNFNLTDVSEHLGPYTISASSAYFTVAGLISFKLKLNEIPKTNKTIKIYKITCLIKQQYRLISIKDKSNSKEKGTNRRAESWPPCQRRKVFQLDHSNTPQAEQIFPSDPRRPATRRGAYQIDSSTDVSDDGRRGSNPGSPSVLTSRDPPSSRVPSISRSRSRIRRLLMTSATRDHSSHEQNNHRRSGPYQIRNTTELGIPSPSSICTDRHEGQAEYFGMPSSHNRIESILRTPRHLPTTEDSSSSVLVGNEENRAVRPAGTGARSVSYPRPSTCNAHQAVDEHIQYADFSLLGEADDQPSSPTTLSSSSTQPINRGRTRQMASGVRSQIGKQTGRSRSRGRKSVSGHGDRIQHASSHECEKEIPLAVLNKDHMSWEIQHTGRLPSDNTIRPSTHPGTQTNIHIFHTLLFEITYTIEDEEEDHLCKEGSCSPVGHTSPTHKVHHQGSKSLSSGSRSHPASVVHKILSIGKPVQIYSCCLMVESMVLPPYSRSDPHPEMVQHPTPQHAARMVKCVCGMSTEMLLNSQNSSTNESAREQREHSGLNASRGGQTSNPLDRLTSSRLEFRPLSDEDASEGQVLPMGYAESGVHPWVSTDYDLEDECRSKSAEA